MAIDKLNGIGRPEELFQSDKTQRTERLKDKFKTINFEGGTAQRKVDAKVIDKALNEPSSHKVLKLLLANSPVGFGNQSTKTELENLGYLDSGMRMTHLGAPIDYISKDGGSVTVYDDTRGPNGQTDAGPRTTIYRNGGFEQTMIYDENGKLTGGKIVIKDKVAGFTERQIDFTVTSDGKIATVE